MESGGTGVASGRRMSVERMRHRSRLTGVAVASQWPAAALMLAEALQQVV